MKVKLHPSHGLFLLEVEAHHAVLVAHGRTFVAVRCPVSPGEKQPAKVAQQLGTFVLDLPEQVLILELRVLLATALYHLPASTAS